MYDPGIGKWISEDPIGFDAKDANPRRYVGNNATNATDPSGLQEIEDILKGIDKVRKNRGTEEKVNPKRTVANVGEVTLTTQGGTGKVTIVNIDDKNVTITFERGEKTETKPFPIKIFKKEDQAFIQQLRAVPANIVIDPFSLKDEGESCAASDWVKAVVRDLSILSKLEKGREILQGIRTVFDPPTQSIRQADGT